VSGGSSDRSMDVSASAIVPQTPPPAPAKVERASEEPVIEVEDPEPEDPEPIAAPIEMTPSIETPPPPPLVTNRPAAKPRSIASVTKKKKSRDEDQLTPVPPPAAEPVEERPPPPEPQEKKGVASVLDGGIRPMQRGLP
jgi:hypothetical protein